MSVFDNYECDGQMNISDIEEPHERYTEYHCGVAVIKDKNKFSEAMAKLALYEDREELERNNPWEDDCK